MRSNAERVSQVLHDTRQESRQEGKKGEDGEREKMRLPPLRAKEKSIIMHHYINASFIHSTQTQNIQKKVQFAETPKRDVVEQSHKDIVESKTTQPHETKTDNTGKETATRTRSGRIITKPVQYKDYV